MSHRALRSSVPCAALLGAAAVAMVAAAPPGKPVAEHPLAQTAEGDPEKMMAEWMASMQPKPIHEWLGRFIGEWDTETTMVMDPAAPPMVSKGHATISWKFPGRFIQEDFRGELMGMPFQGFGMTGFDNAKNQLVGIWCDSMGTGFAYVKGSLSPDMTKMSMVGEMDEPATGEMGKAFLYTVTIHSDDHHTMQMQEIIYGEPFTVMTIDYRRSDSASASHD